MVKKKYIRVRYWPEWPELLPGSSPNNNSKVNCPNLFGFNFNLKSL